jgi:predicted transcriptional regulator
MYGNKSYYREIHLGLEHWNNIPDQNSVSYSYNNDTEVRDKRTFIYQQIIPLLRKIVIQCLTTKQLQVMKLCKLDCHLTQYAAAKILKITQPTVNQHLYGKKRNGKKIGGAYNRIQKTIIKLGRQKNLSAHENMILALLIAFFNPQLSHRKRNELIKRIFPSPSEE